MAKHGDIAASRRKATVYRDADGGWRFRVKAVNGRTVGASEESHVHCDYVVEKAHAQFPDAEVRVVDEASNTDYVVDFSEGGAA